MIRKGSVFGKQPRNASSSTATSADGNSSSTIQYNLPSFLQKKNPFNPNTQAKHLNFAQAYDKENLYYQIFPATGVVPRGIIVTTHSFASHVGQLENIGVRFSNFDYCVAMFDQRGAGRSGGKRGHCKSLQQYLVDLLTIVKQTRKHLYEDLRSELTEDAVNKIPIFFYGHGTGAVMLLLLGIQISIMRKNGSKFNRDAFLTLAGQEPTNAKIDEDEELLTQTLTTLFTEIEPAVTGLIITSPYLRIEFPNWQKKVIGFLAKRFQTYTIDLDVSVDKLTSDVAMQKILHRDTFRVGDMTAKTVTDLEKLCHQLMKEDVSKQLEVPLLMLHGTKDYVSDAVMSKKFFDQIGSSDKAHYYLANFLHAVHLEIEREKMFKLINTWLNERSNANPEAVHFDEGESRVSDLVNKKTSEASPVPRKVVPTEDAVFELEDIESSNKTDAATGVTEQENQNNDTEPKTEVVQQQLLQEQSQVEESAPNVQKSVPEVIIERSVEQEAKQTEENSDFGRTPTGPQSPQDSQDSTNDASTTEQPSDLPKSVEAPSAINSEEKEDVEATA